MRPRRCGCSKRSKRPASFTAIWKTCATRPKRFAHSKRCAAARIGKVLWVRSRETHPGPHSDWFWNKELSGGGAIVDLGCHCIEIARNFIGKDIRPVEVMCWGDTQVHPIEAEDHAIGLVRYENGAIGQFEVSWAFRGGMDLRDEVAGTEGTIWLNHWLRTGMEMYTAVGQHRLRRRKGRRHDRLAVPGRRRAGRARLRRHVHRHAQRARRRHDARAKRFYDGYVVNAIIDAAYASIEKKQWQPVNLPDLARPRIGRKASPSSAITTPITCFSKKSA